MFHDGELAVQRRAGVEDVATLVGRGITPSMPAGFAEFLERQPFVVVAGRDGARRVWASPLVGGVGFARVLDERRLLLGAELPADDPLTGAFERPDNRIGVLALEASTRGRIRVNGTARQVPEGILIRVEEAFGNCPKYIQRRVPVERLEPPRAPSRRSSTRLSVDQVELIRAADTFFIASAHPQRGADASHRGGRPGFVEVADAGARLQFPDYQGNRMFQTLGNIEADPRVGLLFIDWETGAALQLSGRARIVWDPAKAARRPGAERLVAVEVEAVVERERALPARWDLIEPSRLNPPVPRI